MVFCPVCYSNKVRKYGFDRKGRQKHRCNACGKQFTDKTDSVSSGMRYPKAIIMYALNLHHRHGYPLRGIRERLSQLGIHVSHVAVHDWNKKFKPEFMGLYMRHNDYARRWQVNITKENINGKQRYLSSISDVNGAILSVKLTAHDSPEQTINTLLKEALKLTGFRPEVMLGATTDIMQEQIRKFYKES